MTKIAAILCPGPSLPKTWTPALARRYDLTLSVNRGIDFFQTQWLIAGDGITFHRISRAPTVGVVTMREVPEQWKATGYPLQGLQNCVTRLFNDLPGTDGHRMPQWGSTAAITFAVMEGATHIHTYGMDLSGRTEFDRRDPGDIDRTPDRYQREAASLGNTCAWAIARGVTITRINQENPWTPSL